MFLIGNQSPAIDCTLGGSATPAARKARLAEGLGVDRSMNRLPSCSTSVSVNASRSRWSRMAGDVMIREPGRVDGRDAGRVDLDDLGGDRGVGRLVRDGRLDHDHL